MLQTLRQLKRWVGTLAQPGTAPSLFGATGKKSRSAAALLHIPTSDGSGEACHPSAVHIPNGFAGYRFWMVNTPYPENAHKLENPELFGSNDGVFWEVPVGIQNPLVSAPDGDERHYNSDPCLLHHEDRLLLYFRTSDEESGPRRDWISMMTSSNGRDWSEPRPVVNDATGRLLLCPTVRAINGKFLMWTVENAGSPLLTICRRTSADGVNWTTPEPTELLWSHYPLEP
ncbi:MAG: hypothetical protein ACREB5_07495, partial [Sphingomonadaceae bacterium]